MILHTYYIESSPIKEVTSAKYLEVTIDDNDFSSHSSVTSMLSTLNLPPLQQRRERSKLIMNYKIIIDLVDIPKDYFTPNDSRLRKGYYKQLMTKIDSKKFSFPPQ